MLTYINFLLLFDIMNPKTSVRRFRSACEIVGYLYLLAAVFFLVTALFLPESLPTGEGAIKLRRVSPAADASEAPGAPILRTVVAEVTVRSDGNLDLPHLRNVRRSHALVLFASTLGGFGVLFTVRRLLKNIEAGTIFSRSSVNHLRFLAFWFLAAHAIGVIARRWDSHVWAEYLRGYSLLDGFAYTGTAHMVSRGFSADTVLFATLSVLVLAEVFRMAVAMKEENELTV